LQERAQARIPPRHRAGEGHPVEGERDTRREWSEPLRPTGHVRAGFREGRCDRERCGLREVFRTARYGESFRLEEGPRRLEVGATQEREGGDRGRRGAPSWHMP